MKRSILCVLIYLNISIGYCGAQLISEAAELTVSESFQSHWYEDLEYYQTYLDKLHIDPYHTITKTDFSATIEQLKNRISKLTENQIAIELMKLTRMVGDGHTSFPLWGGALQRFPFDFKVINGRTHILGASTRYRYLLGATLVAIDGVAASKVYQQLSTVVPFCENPYSAQVRVAQYMKYANVLDGLGVINNPQRATFEFLRNGHKHTLVVTARTQVEITEQLSIDSTVTFDRVKSVNDDVWFSVSKNKSVVYIKFRRYPSAQDMARFAKSILKSITKNQAKNLIIDLRDNFGGDFFVGLKLAEYLVMADSIDWKNGVYVLINNTTYSAAMSNAAQFSQLLNATLVGEPTGARPSGYQDMGQFALPNSGLIVTYSKRLYHFNLSNKDALYPDKSIELSLFDYLTNNDKQLSWVLAQTDWFADQ